MLEWIRMSLMKRLHVNRDKCERLWEGKKLCPTVREELNRRMGKACDCIALKSTSELYEVETFDGRRYSVDLKNMSCSCREWDLSGIPCCHGLSAIGAEKLDMEDFVHSCYTIETYNKVYISTLQPMVGVNMWEKTGYIPPLPPNFGKKKKGRPSRARRRGVDEEPSGRTKKKNKTEILPKQPFKVSCSFCKHAGHNERTCEWKKFAEEFPDETPPEKEQNSQDVENPPLTENTPMDEMMLDGDIPPLTQQTQPDQLKVSSEKLNYILFSSHQA
ncbi:hypothetical protein ACS0TY_020667 [Phlomoides rotata]